MSAAGDIFLLLFSCSVFAVAIVIRCGGSTLVPFLPTSPKQALPCPGSVPFFLFSLIRYDCRSFLSFTSLPLTPLLCFRVCVLLSLARPLSSAMLPHSFYVTPRVLAFGSHALVCSATHLPNGLVFFHPSQSWVSWEVCRDRSCTLFWCSLLFSLHPPRLRSSRPGFAVSLQTTKFDTIIAHCVLIRICGALANSPVCFYPRTAGPRAPAAPSSCSSTSALRLL